jgi:hypothetical protein
MLTSEHRIDYHRIYMERIERADRRLAAGFWFCVGAVSATLAWAVFS